MMARREFGRGALGLLGGAASAVLTGCGLIETNASYRFRITVEVDTPQGLKRGSGVMEVFAHKYAPTFIEEGSGFTSGLKRGEAIAVDLPGGPMFALLTASDGMGNLGGAVTGALAPESRHGDWQASMAAVRKLGEWSAHYKADLPRTAWPMMVRFRDLGDPKSVELVDPDAAGVKRISLETTRDAVTTGIDKRIPWLKEAENFHYSGTAYGDLYRLPSASLRSGLK